MSRFCTGCGKPIESDEMFCRFCGKKVEDDQVTQAANPPQNPAQPQASQQPAPQQSAPQQPAFTSPAQPAQYGAPNPAPQPPAEKKSKTGLIIGIIAGVAVIAAIVVLLVVFVFNKQDDTTSAKGGDQATASSSAEDKTEAAAAEETEKETEKATEKETDEAKTSDGADPFGGEDNIKLTVWVPDTAVDVTNERLRAFLEEYKSYGKEIEITTEVMGESNAATQMLNDKDAAADVFGYVSDQFNKLMNANALSPVPEPDDIVARNSEPSVKAVSDDSGKLYAYPESDDNGYFLVYDKSIVSDEDAKTLEGVLSACRKAGKKFVMDAGNGYYSCVFAFTGGLELNGLSADGVQQFNNYDEESVLDSLETFAKLFHEYSDVFLCSETAKIPTGMTDRTVAAGIDGTWDTAAIKEALGDNYGAAKLPTVNINGQDKQMISLHGYKAVGVNSGTKFPNTAHLLADFLTNEESQIRRAEELEWGPSNTSAKLDDSVRNSPAISAVLDQSAFTVPQVNMSDTFWSPMATLGNALWKNDDYSRDTLRSEFEKAIKSISDY